MRKTEHTATCDLGLLAEGMPADQFISYMGAICDFLKKVNEKLRAATGDPRAQVNVLTSGHLLTFKEEGVDSIMVVGRSADFGAAEKSIERDIRSELASGLSRYDRNKTIFFPGGHRFRYRWGVS